MIKTGNYFPEIFNFLLFYSANCDILNCNFFKKALLRTRTTHFCHSLIYEVFIVNAPCKSCAEHKECGNCNRSLQEAIRLISSAFRTNHKLLACGNGGSCSDSDHIVAEFIKTKVKKSSGGYVGFKAISLCSNSSVLTAISNDFGFDWIYAQQIDALGDPGDVLLAISTSGNSRNVLLALEAARMKGMHTILLTGQSDHPEAPWDCAIQACGNSTEEIQEKHIVIYHNLCRQVISICTDNQNRLL